MTENGSTNKAPMNKIPLVLLVAGFCVLGYGLWGKKSPSKAPAPTINAAPQVQTWGWRNDGSGRFDKVNPPLEWAFEKNIKWVSKLETWSNASPVLARGQLFFCEEPNILVAAEANTGKVLWRKSVSYIDALPKEKQAGARAELAQFDAMDEELKEGRGKLAQDIQLLRRGSDDAKVKERVNQQTKHLNDLKIGVAKAIRYRTPETNDLIGYTSSTPVTDGKHIYTLFANGVLASFDMEGNQVWARWLGDPLTRETGDHMNGYAYGNAASLILVGGRLVLAYSYLLAIDATNGETIWKSDMYQDFGTPVHMRVSGIDLIALPDGSIVRLSDGVTLKEDLAYTWYIGPTAFEDKLFVMGAGSDEELLDENKAKAAGYQLSFDPQGNLQAKELWKVDIHGDRYYATPLYYEGQLYNISRLGVLVSIDARTGRVKYEEKLPVDGSQVFASPAAAGGKIFINTEMGVTLILEHGPQYKLLHKNLLLPTRSSPFFYGDEMFIRSEDGLYAVKEPKKS